MQRTATHAGFQTQRISVVNRVVQNTLIEIRPALESYWIFGHKSPGARVVVPRSRKLKAGFRVIYLPKVVAFRPDRLPRTKEIGRASDPGSRLQMSVCAFVGNCSTQYPCQR